MNETRWVLVGLAGPVKGRDFVLIADEVRIGRTAENDIVVAGKSVSRHHASFFTGDGKFWIQDMNSKNGTFVNQRKVSKGGLARGDIVRVGEAKFRVTSEGAAPHAPGDGAPAGLGARLAIAAQAARAPENRRRVLYAGGAIVLALALLALPRGQKRPSPGGKNAAEESAAPDDGLPGIEASDQQVADWSAQVDIVMQNEDYSAAVQLLRKVVAARPQDLRSKSKLTQVESRLKSRIALYDENGAREFEKLNYDRAIMEWQMVLALAKGFDAETYKRAQARIGEAEEKLRGRKP